MCVRGKSGGPAIYRTGRASDRARAIASGLCARAQTSNLPRPRTPSPQRWPPPGSGRAPGRPATLARRLAPPRAGNPGDKIKKAARGCLRDARLAPMPRCTLGRAGVEGRRGRNYTLQAGRRGKQKIGWTARLCPAHFPLKRSRVQAICRFAA
jgi:hypothetical protein